MSGATGAARAAFRRRSCGFFDWCNGNLRVRAEVAGGDLTGEDPACYLTPEETAAGPGASRASSD